MRISGKTILIAISVEAASMVATRLALKAYPNALIEVEMFRTVLRLLTAGLYWWLFRNTLKFKITTPLTPNRYQLFLALGLLFSVPVLVGNDRLSPVIATVFALTSIAVAVKEEVLFRGAMQGLLAERFGQIAAIAITSVFFTAWHLGVRPISFSVFMEIFLVSVILGRIYMRSGGLTAAIGVHAVYDAIYSFSPYFAHPYNRIVGIFILIYATLLTYNWATRGKAVSAPN